MIVKMQHLDLVCLKSDKEKVLESLRALGAMHLDLGAMEGEAITSAKNELADAERMIRLIEKARGKEKDWDERERSVAQLLILEKDESTLKAELDRLEREIRYFEPFGDFDPVLAAKVRDDLERKGLTSELAALNLPSRLPEMRLSRLQEKLARVKNRLAIDEDKFANSSARFILKQYPGLKDRLAFEQAKELMGTAGELCFVSGWLPKTMDLPSLKSTLPGTAVLLREPVAGEVPPTLVEPPKAFKAMKALFSGLGIAPAYTEGDVSVPFMCYFTLFFAMLVGDGAYGAIFLLGTLAMRKKLPKAWFTLLTVFSSATILWGLLSNTWFGANIPWCADWPTVKWLADPSYHNMMLLCFTIGVSHLMLARIWNGFLLINTWDCLPEFGWAGVLFFMYLVTNAVVGIFSGIPVWSYYVLGASLALIVSRTRGASLGMLPLNVMSTLGDIISYVRLFAVGLASVKVAENFNSMAIGLVSGDKAWWLKAALSLGLVAILLIGHALNLAMAGLSILVHAVRLNTLEFSNHKGVSWSGYAYKAFKKNQ